MTFGNGNISDLLLDKDVINHPKNKTLNNNTHSVINNNSIFDQEINHS